MSALPQPHKPTKLLIKGQWLILRGILDGHKLYSGDLHNSLNANSLIHAMFVQDVQIRFEVLTAVRK